MTRRLAVQRVLGAIWIFDGLLQFRPVMMTRGFIAHDVLPLAQGEPGWLHAFIQWDAHLLLLHPVWSDVGVGAIQLVIGLLLLTRRFSGVGLLTSFVWALAVWVAGEGFGQIFTGMSWLGNGAPGAALLYALLSWGLHPSWSRERRVRYFRIVSACLWIFEGIVSLGPASHGLVHAFGLTICLAIAGLTLFIRGFNWGSVFGMAVAGVSWAVGQHWGQFWEPYATDPNTGLLLALLSACVLVFAASSRTGLALGDAEDKSRSQVG